MALYETSKEILQNLDENNFIYGEIVVDIEDIVNLDADDFMDLLSDEMVGNDALLEIEYRPLSVNRDGMIVMGVYANPRIVIEDLRAEEQAGRSVEEDA